MTNIKAWHYNAWLEKVDKLATKNIGMPTLCLDRCCECFIIVFFFNYKKVNNLPLKKLLYLPSNDEHNFNFCSNYLLYTYFTCCQADKECKCF